MCEAATFTEIKRAEIRKRITQEQETILNERTLNELISKAHDRLTALDKTIQEIRPRGLQGGDLDFLGRLMQGAEQVLSAYLAQYEDLFNAFDSFKNAHQALRQYLDNLKTRLMDGTQASQVA
jgi:hypothetical protein